MILKILKLLSPKGSCNFENFQNHLYLLITNCNRGRAISYTNLNVPKKEKNYQEKRKANDQTETLFIGLLTNTKQCQSMAPSATAISMSQLF